MAFLKSVRGLALFVLLVGGPAIGFLTVMLNFSITFTLFRTLSAREQFLGALVLFGPLPLCAGALLLFFRRTQRLGSVSTVTGSLILAAYLFLDYARLSLSYASALEGVFWYGVIPVAVIAVNAAAFRIHKLTKSLPPNAKAATSAH